MEGEKTLNQALISSSFFLFVALNFPLLGVFNQQELVGGVPILFLYLFVLWTVAVIGLALALGRKRPEP